MPPTANLAQNALCHVFSGLLPRDQRAASHPPISSNGTFNRLMNAKSSFGRPFSMSFKGVTSWIWNPIFATRCKIKKDWMSIQMERSVESLYTRTRTLTFQTDDTPHDLVNLFHVHIRVIVTGRILLLGQDEPYRENEEDSSPGF